MDFHHELSEGKCIKEGILVQHDYVVDVIGSGFGYSKKRIYEMFDQISDPMEREECLKKNIDRAVSAD